jgi:CRP-like cAMP-binding protein
MPEQRPMIGNIAPYLRLLREHAIFGELPEQALKDLVIRSDLIGFAAAEPLLRQGEPSDAIWLITQGEVDVRVDSSLGPVVLGRACAGALLGEIGVFADLPRTANVSACTDVEALRIGRDDMLQIGGEDPAFLRAVMKQLGARIAAFNQSIAYYTDALNRLEQPDFDPVDLTQSPQPLPELVNFATSFRRLAERFGLRRASSSP